MRAAGTAIALLALWQAYVALEAFDTPLDRRAIEEAISLGRSGSDADRRRFHSSYRIAVANPPVDWIDVITPFHRIQLAAEEAARTGSRFGQAEARQLIGSGPERLELLVEMTFHPLNAFVGVPSYEVVLLRGDLEIQPIGVNRFPRFGPRLGSETPLLPGSRFTVPAAGETVVGGTIVATFDVEALERSQRYEVVVADGDRALARAKIDLAAMR